MKTPHALLGLTVVLGFSAALAACSGSPSGAPVIFGADGSVIGPGGPTGPMFVDAGPVAPGSSTGSGSSSPSGSGQCVPANVASLLGSKCNGCHSDPPPPSYLTGLVTLADLMATSHLDPTKNEAQESVALMTLTSGATAMPIGTGSPAADIAVLQSWITGGYATVACGPTSSSGSGTSSSTPSGVFANAPAFAAPSSSGKSAHNAGQNCLSCHKSGGSSGSDAKAFTAAGTVYDATGKGVGGAEVRIVDANNNATSVYTGSTGTFYFTGAWTAPAKIGVRNASAVQNMNTPLLSGSQPPASSGGACSACHCTGGSCTIAAVHLP